MRDLQRQPAPWVQSATLTDSPQSTTQPRRMRTYLCLVMATGTEGVSWTVKPCVVWIITPHRRSCWINTRLTMHHQWRAQCRSPWHRSEKETTEMEDKQEETDRTHRHKITMWVNQGKMILIDMPAQMWLICKRRSTLMRKRSCVSRSDLRRNRGWRREVCQIVHFWMATRQEIVTSKSASMPHLTNQVEAVHMLTSTIRRSQEDCQMHRPVISVQPESLKISKSKCDTWGHMMLIDWALCLH